MKADKQVIEFIGQLLKNNIGSSIKNLELEGVEIHGDHLTVRFGDGNDEFIGVFVLDGSRTFKKK